MRYPYLPRELINIILEYDGRIRYNKGKYQINIDNELYKDIKQNIIDKQFISKTIPLNYRTLLSIKKIGFFNNCSQKFIGFEELEFISDEIKPYNIYHYIIKIYREKINILRDGGISNFYQMYT